jgi:SLT domain-containing protein
MLGIPHTVSAWLRQIASESGGNANAVQGIRDVNWPHNLARGLLQVIPTTFAAQRGNPFGSNIMSPAANVWAAMKYAIGRYGARLLSVIGRGHGYAYGGPVTEPVVGFGLRSGDAYSFAERGPEWVSPLGGPGAMAGLGARGTTINVYPSAGMDERDLARAVSRELGWAYGGVT